MRYTPNIARREFLVMTGAGGLALLAGCGSQSDGGASNGSGTRTTIGPGDRAVAKVDEARGGSGKVTSFGTLRGRVGYAWERALFYGTLGFAGANVKGNTIAVNASPPVATYIGSGSNFHVGYAIGLGVEYALTRNISSVADLISIPSTKIRSPVFVFS